MRKVEPKGWTPGPWEFIRGLEGWDVVVHGGTLIRDLGAADARLIAAAPEMAALLDALVAADAADGADFDAALGSIAPLLARIRGETDA